MASVKFKKGLLAQLAETAKQEGTFYVTTDERGLYLDISGTDRIRLGDFREVDDLEALQALPESAHQETALYYIKDINVLAKWKPNGDPGTPEADAGQWVQINPDTGATGVDEQVEGSGNAVTGITYDSTSRKLKLKKETTFVADSDLTEKLGELGGKSVQAYVEEKTKNVATNDQFSTLEGRVEAAEGKLTTLEGEDGQEGSVKHAVKSLEDKLNPEIEALKTTVGKKVEPGQGTSTGLVKKVDDLEALVGPTSVDGQIQTKILELKLSETYAPKTHEHGMEQVTGLSTALEQKATTEDMTQAKADITELKSKIGGLTGAMHFKGKAKSDPAQMDPVEDEYALGDVVLWNEKEYVLVEEESELEAPSPKKKFVELGDTTDDARRLTELESWKSTTDGKISTLEGEKHTHTNQALLETYKQSETDLADAVAKKHEHTNSEELAKITVGKVEAWDSAKSEAVEAAKTASETAIAAAKKELIGEEERSEADTIKGAKKYADEKDEALKTEITNEAKQGYEAADEKKLTEAKTYADTLVTWGSF